MPSGPGAGYPRGADFENAAVVNAALASSAVTWADLHWIRDGWRGPIVVKGILTGDDGRRAVDEGAAAISVSNHGGRQLDCVPAALRALPEVVAAVNGQVEVLMDGGIRRGTDIVKAICLGARAVLGWAMPGAMAPTPRSPSASTIRYCCEMSSSTRPGALD